MRLLRSPGIALPVLALAMAAGWAGSAGAAEQPAARVEGSLDEDLRDIVVRAVGVSQTQAETNFEARRRAREAAERAVAALRSEGFYGPDVTPDVGEGAPPTPVVRITPGPRFTFLNARIDWIGGAPDQDTQDGGRGNMNLPDGMDGRAAEVIESEGRIVSFVRSRGYPDVVAQPREVIVDHADASIQPAFRIAAGEQARLNGVELASQGRTRLDWVQDQVPWASGDLYDPAVLAELELRLRDTGIYDQVSVSLAPKERATAEGYRPVVVTLGERARRRIEADAGWSTGEGFGLSARYILYNRLRRADTTTFSLRLAQNEQRFGGEVSLPSWRRPQQTLKINASILRQDTDAFVSQGVLAGADVTRRYGRNSYLTYGLTADVTQTREKTRANNVVTVGDSRLITRLTGLGVFSHDRSDDVLDPRAGWRINARLEPTLTQGDNVVPAYLKAQIQGSYYRSFGAEARTVLAARLKLGSILGGLIPEVPADRRLYAGGGGSVRGYVYQAVGPRLPDNTPQGGLSLAESSIEVRHNFTEQWGAAAFVDTGSVSSDTTLGQADFRAAVGAGVRYNLGFGPIRADIAIPVNKRKDDASFQIYLSIGQSF